MTNTSEYLGESVEELMSIHAMLVSLNESCRQGVKEGKIQDGTTILLDGLPRRYRARIGKMIDLSHGTVDGTAYLYWFDQQAQRLTVRLQEPLNT